MSDTPTFPVRSLPVLEGGLTIWLELEANQAGWEDVVRGILVLRGTGVRVVAGKAEVLLASIKRSDRHDEYVRQRLDWVTWRTISISSDETLRLPFNLEVPWKTGFNDDTHVLARITWPVGRDTVLSLGVRVLPPRAFLHVAEVFGELAELGVTSWHSSQSAGELRASLQRLPHSSGPLYRAWLGLQRQSHQVMVAIDAELAPRGLADRFLGRWTGRHRSTRLTLSVSDAEAHSAALHQNLSAAMDRLLTHNLPVPANGPVTAADHLPRPASLSSGNPALADES